MTHSLLLKKIRYGHLKSIFRFICALIASNVWLIIERSQLRNENDEFKTKFDQYDTNFEEIKANFNVTEEHITNLKDSFDNLKSDVELEDNIGQDFHNLTKNFTSLGQN